MDNNLFGTVEGQKSEAVKKIKNGIQKYLIFFVLLFNILLEIISKLYTFGLHNPFSAEFVLSVSLSTMTTVVCYLIFIPFGRYDERKRNLDYEDINNDWKNLSKIVRLGFLSLFEIFCKDQVTAERNDAKRHLLENNTVIPFEEYKEKYEGMTKKELKALYKRSLLSKKDFKALKRANGYGLFNPTKIKAINPVIILAGTIKSSLNDAGRSNSSTIPRKLVLRLALSLVVSIVLNAIRTRFVGGGDDVILDMIFSVAQIVVASIGGYSGGVDEFRYTVDKINSRVIFLSLFCEKNKIEIKEAPSK